MNLDKKLTFYKGRRVLVTGDTGFKGSWLSLWLAELGAEVAGVALPPERSEDHYNVAEIGAMIQHYDQDIRDAEGTERIIAEFQPEIVFHLAAQALVRLSYRQPRETFETNLMGSVNLLEAVRKVDSVRAVIYVTSDKCYRNKEWEWGYRENDELGGRDPYSASKAAAELVLTAYRESFFRATGRIGAASVRAGNVIGGGDWSLDRIFPDCIRSLANGKPIRLRNPRAVRPWQHVLEPLSGYLLLGRRLFEEPQRWSEAWNFGPSNEGQRTVEELAREVIRSWGAGSIEIEPEPNAPHEEKRLFLNCDKAWGRLEWRPRWDFATAVRKAVEWYRATREGESAGEFSRRQIQQYMGGEK
ncbi:MAG: CDP-glucose 4,6-dehydratase [Candidatus Hydrogenedentota bacterium]|nr:MAG: CDP-glucose 4,6-dehydratase [Candidatus Hydrogenedentota bacterium]